MSVKSFKRLPSGMLAERDAFELAAAAWKTGRAKTAWSFHVKAGPSGALSETGSTAGAGSSTGQYGGIVPPEYAGIYEPPTRPLVVADLFAPGSTNSNLVRLVKQDPETLNDAGATSEGSDFGEVDFEVRPQDYKICDHTARLTVTEDFLEDVLPAADYIAMRLGRLVRLAEEDMLVSGTGIAPDLIGLLHAADDTESATTHSQGSDILDVAMAHIAAKTFDASGQMPTWVLMSPSTWLAYIVGRSDAGAGTFLSGHPSQISGRTAWGMSLVLSKACPDNKVIVGSPAAATRFVHTSGMQIASSGGYALYFGASLILVKAKLRTTLAYERPSGVGILSLASASVIGS